MNDRRCRAYLISNQQEAREQTRSRPRSNVHLLPASPCLALEAAASIGSTLQAIC